MNVYFATQNLFGKLTMKKKFKIGQVVENRLSHVQLFDHRYEQKNKIGVVIGHFENKNIVKWESGITLEDDIYLMSYFARED